MKISVYSDVHLEFGDFVPPDTDCEVVVLAGDIHVGDKGLAWARKHFPSQPVVYVLGNHEYYGQAMESLVDTMRGNARELGIHLLENHAVEIEGVRFLGSTLWTDFKFYGDSAQAVRRAMHYATHSLADFSSIFLEGRHFRPTDAAELNRQAVAWLRQSLDTPFSGPTVVVTHHLPHELSVDERYVGDLLNPCFASRLNDLVRAPVDLWIHGHTHCSCDYVVNGTRVVCNPRGYAGWELNPEFNPSLELEL